MSARRGRWAERVLARFADSISDEEKRLTLLARWRQRSRLAVRLLAGGYTLFLVALWASMRTWGEAHVTYAFLLYLPPAGWLLPLLPLILLALLIDWRSLAICFLSFAVVLWGLMGLSLNSRKEAPVGAQTFTVLSYNRGESANTSLQPFKNAVKPDVIVLQVTPAHAGRFQSAPGYEEFTHADSIGEFTIMSRHPITAKELIPHRDILNKQRNVAAKFTVDVAGKPVAVYSVHLMTPREALLSLRAGAFLWGILGPLRDKWAAKRESYERFWRNHVEAAATIIQRAEAETIPCIVAGDFNAAAQGLIHRRITQKFADSHEAAGFGFGYTFPGITRNPLSLGGPWLRIDKILSGPGWRPLWSQAEPHRPSQHRAIAAQYVLE